MLRRTASTHTTSTSETSFWQRHRARAASAGLCALLLLAGCGDGGPGADPATEPAADPAADPAIALPGADFVANGFTVAGFTLAEPAAVEPVTVAPAVATRPLIPADPSALRRLPGGPAACTEEPCGAQALASDDCIVSLAMNATDLVWIRGCGDMAIRKMPRDGSAPPVTLARLASPGHLALDATHVYYDDGGAGSAGLYRVALDRLSAPERLATLACEALELAADEEYIYWRDNCGTVEGIEKSGAGRRRLLSGLECAAGPVVRRGRIHVVDPCQGRLFSAHPDETRPWFAPVRTSACAPVGPVAIDDHRISWVDGCERRARTVSLAGGVPVAAGECVGEIRLLDGALFFTSQCEGGLFRMDRFGGSLTTVLELDTMPRTFLVDPDALYWTQDGQLWKRDR